MEAVLEAKKKQTLEEEKTPQKKKRVPGEVPYGEKNISSSDVRRVDNILRANGLEIEKLREINRYHPGFLRCVINLAANCAVGVSYEGGDIAHRAMNYLRAKRKLVQRSSTVLDMDNILKENGLEVSKLQEIEKFHPGFADCVVNLATNPQKASSKYSADMLTRAKNYLRGKRIKAGYEQRNNIIRKKVNFEMHTKFAMERGGNTSMRISGQRDVTGNGVHSSIESYDFLKEEQFGEQFRNTESQVPHSVTYNGPVFNNCSFGSIPENNSQSSDRCGKSGASGSAVSKKNKRNWEVPKRKRFKTAEELGLRLE